ncbi:MAG: mechanosensitive ion channel, partial [Clostridia bacterium]|nr:mechanosensitive ion channel [Clostridia bacterium]
MNSKPKNKTLLIVEIVALALVVILFAGCLVLQLAMPESALSVWTKENVWDINETLVSLKSHVPVLIESLVYIVLVYAVCRLVRMIFGAKMQKNPRSKTIFSLLDGFVKYACAIAVILLVLKACGVDTTALIASVGVLTLVVGLGAQPLIADIIAGIFIIFEDEYHVGEIVTINDFRGTVMEIGIRSTKLLDAAGNIKIINNSAIGDVINLSRELSLAVVDCDF